VSVLPETLTVQGFVKDDFSRYIASQHMEFHVSNWTFGESWNDIAIGRIDGFTQTPIFLWNTDLVDGASDSEIEIGNEVVFSGYPDGIEAEDSSLPSMVLRKGVVASHPAMNIVVPGALGKDYCLVDAFSQNGFSGSPVFALIYRVLDLHQTLEDFAERNLDRRVSFFGSNRILLQSSPEFVFLGVNCGHFKTASDRSSGVHAGLSYYIKSSVVLSTLASCANVEKLDRFVTVGSAQLPLSNALQL